jgi:glycosidase
MQFTLLGAPQIYYGDEAGMWGGDDPDCRKPMVWKELTYKTETTHPFGKPRPADEVKFDQPLFNWYKNLVGIRKANKTLSLGEIEFDAVDSTQRILAYKRVWQKESVVIIINNNPHKAGIELNRIKFLSGKTNWTDQLKNTLITVQNGIIELAPYQILILK